MESAVPEATGAGEFVTGPGGRLRVAPVPREGLLPHVVLSFFDSFRLVFRWEGILLVGLPVLLTFVLLPRLLSSGARILGSSLPMPLPPLVSPEHLIQAVVHGATLGTAIALLVPYSEGRRGLDVGFLRRHFPSALLAGTMIAVAVLVLEPLSVLVIKPLAVDSRQLIAFRRAHWAIVSALAYVAARECAARVASRRGEPVPGLWSLLRVGTGVLSVSVLGPIALPTFLAWQSLNPWSRRSWAEGVPGPSFASHLLAMFGLLWFLRCLARLRT